MTKDSLMVEIDQLERDLAGISPKVSTYEKVRQRRMELIAELERLTDEAILKSL